MRPIRLLLVYLLGVFLTGALIAPWLAHLARWGAAAWPALHSLQDVPFHRFVHRALLGCALIFLWPLLRRLRMGSWRDLGLTQAREPLKNLGAGFLIGWGSLAVVATLAILSGARQWNTTVPASELLRVCRNAAFTAIVVAVVEECVFRGAIFGMLRQNHSWPVALVVSSAVYAIVHFFSRPESPSQITWLSGFVVLGGMLKGFADWNTVMPGFITLFLAGSILALAYQRTRNLYCSIGLHAGWIFWLKSYYMMTTTAGGMNSPVWGSDKLIDGWGAMAVLTFVLLLFLREPQQAPVGTPTTT